MDLKDNNAQQTQIVFLSEQEVQASQGVNYCSTTQSDYRPQSELEKNFRRDAYNRSKASKQRESASFSDKKKKTTWTSDYRRKYLKSKATRNGTLTIKPHAGLEFDFSNLKDQASLANMYLPEEVWSKLEDIVLLFTSLSEAVSYTQISSIFLLYLKTHYHESLVKKAFQAFKEVIEFDEEEANSPHAGTEKPDWLSDLRNGLTNWRLITSNPVFKKISYLISICISLGLCDAASFEWKLGNMKLFAIPAMEKHFGALDLIDAAIETVTFFVEGGYACFQSGSLTPLLYSDLQALEFDNEFSFLVSSLEHVKTGNLRKFTDIDENDYDKRLHSCLELAKNLYLSAKGTWEKKIFYDRMAQLKKIRTTFDSIRVQGGLRVAPFTVNFYGKSGVGKSSVSAVSMVVGLLSNGFGAEDEMMATLNESDKYMSNYRSFINGIFMDDVGNTKPDFVEKSPTNKIIEICNNVRQYANMAEADMKGKISIEPKFVNLTTNVKSLCAHVYSAEPVSIARRAHITVTVRVKKQFCSSGMAGSVGQQLDSEKVSSFYTNSDGLVDIPVIPDLWELDVEKVIPSPQPIGPDAISYEFFEFEGKKMEKVDIHTYLRFMIEKSRKYFEQQNLLVSNSNNLAAKITMCDTCKSPQLYCSCCKPESGFIGYAFGVALGQVSHKVTSTVMHCIAKEGKQLETLATNKLLSLAMAFEESPYYKWTNWVPESWLSHDYGRHIIMYAYRDEILNTIRQEMIASISASVLLVILAFMYNILFILPAIYLLYRSTCIVRTVKERIYLEIKNRNDTMPHVFKQVRDNYSKYIWATLGVVGTLYTLLKIWQGFRSPFVRKQGNLNPETLDDVEERDSEVNPWSSVAISKIPTNVTQQTTTAEQLIDLVHKNQVFLRAKQHDGNRISGAVFIKSNVLLMPYHMWFVSGHMQTEQLDEIDVEIMRAPRNLTGSYFRAFFSSNCMVRIPYTDLCIVWVPNAGSYRDLTPYLPIEGIKGGICSMIYRDGNGERLLASANVTPAMVGHSEMQFNGGKYNLSIPTFNGLCMATFISRSRTTQIVGFHLGGVANSTKGILGTISLGEFERAFKILGEQDCVLLSKSEGELKTSLYDVNFVQSDTVHHKSPVNYLEEGTNFKVFGSCLGMTTAHSEVTQTLISDTVEKVTGVPQQWGSPSFKPAWKPWQESLKYSTRPSIGVEGTYLAWAIKDYKQPLIELLRTNKWLHENIRPLTEMETVCGVDGLRFIDKMSPKTSVGYPLNGAKSKYITILDPLQYPDQQFPVELDSKFWDEFRRMEECYLRGERTYPVFKGCLKDEPTKLTKNKVRVFQAAPIALQLGVRKYYLPIARFLSIYPLISECAVGINSQGPEWNTLQTFITKFGKDRIFAGDYSKYDLRMPAQVMFAAFKILIDIAKYTGNYSEDHISIMEGLATDICYPVMAYNGTLLQLIGSNPSGQNLTVYINSIVNSLLNRCGFYKLMSESSHKAELLRGKLNFRDAVALMTYGDDVKGSVKKGYDEFNHVSYAQFMEEHDMKFTMPDKESTPVPYMKDEDADFLKRKNIFNEDVQMYFGALDESSIFKSLHATLRSKFLNAEEQAVENIDGALREWFAHGRDVYETRRKQMLEIASQHNLVCNETYVSYDDRLTSWKDKYIPSTE